MVGGAGRLFTMNIGRPAVVCLFNTLPIFARLQFEDRAGNRRENTDTAAGAFGDAKYWPKSLYSMGLWRAGVPGFGARRRKDTF